jgi:FKBP-type peptidyl-prolyl cis-trans isomerase
MKPLLWITCSILFLTACKKNASKCEYTESSVTATSSERTYLENYLATNSITATQLSSGVFYTINAPGTGGRANVCSVIRVKYSGYLLNGTMFDYYTATTGISFELGQLIVGWQKGLPEVASGGTITLYIPPSLGYGAVEKRDANGNIVIPANSYLKFVIELLDVQ